MNRKHEKTHSRPWKCSEPDCKYNEYGWPTEKERDRHVNDKHSSAPPLFQCEYHPCPYQSKRESNCKQHMEKAHGWIYVRSKNNGRKGKKIQAEKTPAAVQMTTPRSSAVEPSTPLSGVPPSPYDQYGFPDTYSAGGSTSASEQITPYSSGSVVEGSLNGFGDRYDYSATNFDFNTFPGTFAPPRANGVFSRHYWLPPVIVRCRLPDQRTYVPLFFRHHPHFSRPRPNFGRKL